MRVAPAMITVSLAVGLGLTARVVAARQRVPAVDPAARPFTVTYVTPDAVYLDGGSDSGLAEGTRLMLRRRAPGASLSEGIPVGEVEVFAVTSNSAVCEIVSLVTPVMEGDVAYLSTSDRVALEANAQDEPETRYAQVVTFTLEDPLEQEIRQDRPIPPLPEVNRFRGRIGFEHGSIHDHVGSGSASYQEGLYLRADITRIGGSFWNLTGYWRGRLNARTPDPQDTLTDLTNRVYHIGLYYNNPASRFTAGAGRLLVPWASSLSTLDGGYIGVRAGSATLGVFGGSTPDPTAWDYAPERTIFGSFVNIQKGHLDSTHYTGTAGVALTHLSGVPERQFLFLENSLQFGPPVSVFNNMEIDYRGPDTATSGSDSPVITRSFVTFRFRPFTLLALDLNHNYFRIFPTYDPRLAGTGLLDDLLFEGLSGGIRVEPSGSGLTLYTRLGRSRRDDDTRASLNQMYGVAFSRLPGGLRVDARYSLFDGPFGSGTYRSVALRHSGNRLQIEGEGGSQRFDAENGQTHTARYLNVHVDWFQGRNLVWGGGGSVYRGNQQRYDQIFFSVGYRFQPTAQQD